MTIIPLSFSTRLIVLTFLLSGALAAASLGSLGKTAAAAPPPERAAALYRFLDALASEPNLDAEAKLHHAWTGYILAERAAERGKVLAFAATIPDSRARMLIGSFREFTDLRQAYADANRTHGARLPLAPAPVGTDPKKRRSPREMFGINSFDAPFSEDRWEDPHGFAGRWTVGDTTLDVAAYPCGNFVGRFTPAPGAPRRTLIGFPAGKTLRLIGPGVRGELEGGTLNLVQGDSPRTLRRTPVGRSTFAARPAGARVLLDATTGLRNFRPSSGDAAWKVHPDGVIEIDPEKGSLFSREKFGDLRAYLEFRHAYNSESLGPRRGNSGLYVFNTYEIQLVDSFGEAASETSAGSVYHIAPPRVQASAPPLEWQSLEIDFRAPRFDAGGRKIASARLTAWHNGVKIHDDLEVPNPTAGSAASGRAMKDPEPPQPLMLQNHGNRVQFRNIWVLPLPIKS